MERRLEIITVVCLCLILLGAFIIDLLIIYTGFSYTPPDDIHLSNELFETSNKHITIIDINGHPKPINNINHEIEINTSGDQYSVAYNKNSEEVEIHQGNLVKYHHHRNNNNNHDHHEHHGHHDHHGNHSHHDDNRDKELHQLTEELLAADTNSVFSLIDVTFNGPKLLHVPDSVLQGPTISALRTLQADYHPDVGIPEHFTQKHFVKQTQFLDAVMKTEIMKITDQYLLQKDYIKKPLQEVLEEIWFTIYSRSNKGPLSSSGFEHSFCGEIRQKTVLGFHNWVHFYDEQEEGNLEYDGQMKTVNLGREADLIRLRFRWHRARKPVGGMFIGTSPELEMAVYTICFFAKPNSDCSVMMDGKTFNIKTFDIHGKKIIGSAYPEV